VVELDVTIVQRAEKLWERGQRLQREASGDGGERKHWFVVVDAARASMDDGATAIF
jgi:hypothetical protein